MHGRKRPEPQPPYTPPRFDLGQPGLHTHYSCARTVARTPRNCVFADSLVQAVLDLAETLDCPALMENPHSGLLKTRGLVQGIPYQIVDYCMYHDSRSSHTARKQTAIWCLNGVAWQPQRSLCEKDCGHCTGKRHNETAQRGPSIHGGRRHTWQNFAPCPPSFVKNSQIGQL